MKAKIYIGFEDANGNPGSIELQGNVIAHPMATIGSGDCFDVPILTGLLVDYGGKDAQVQTEEKNTSVYKTALNRLLMSKSKLLGVYKNESDIQWRSGYLEAINDAMKALYECDEKLKGEK